MVNDCANLFFKMVWLRLETLSGCALPSQRFNSTVGVKSLKRERHVIGTVNLTQMQTFLIHVQLHTGLYTASYSSKGYSKIPALYNLPTCKIVNY